MFFVPIKRVVIRRGEVRLEESIVRISKRSQKNIAKEEVTR